MADTAKTVASIWQEVLGVTDLAPEADFFALGGTSLHAARVVTKTRAALDVKLSAQTLLEHPTLAAFSAQVRAAQGSETPASWRP